MKFSSSKTLRVFMAFVLALGLMPLPAYAAPSDGGGSTDIVAGKSPALTTQGSEQTVGEVIEESPSEELVWNDLSNFKPYGQYLYNYYGSEIEIHDIELINTYGGITYLSADYDVSFAVFDGSGTSYGNELPDLGDYTIVVTALDDGDYTGSITLEATVFEGKDIANYVQSFDIPQIEGIFYHDEPITIEDIPEITEKYGDGTFVKGQDYTYRIIRSLYDQEEVTEIDQAGTDYYLEFTGINEYSGIGYVQIEIMDPHSVSYADVNLREYVKVGSESMKPVIGAKLDGTPLAENYHYELFYYETDKYGSYETPLDGMPTEPGYYVVGISGIDEHGFFGYQPFRYVVLPEDYAGEITEGCITINGQTVEEFSSTNQMSIADESSINVSISIDGIALQEGEDFSVEINDGDGIYYGQVNTLCIMDLREPTTLASLEGTMINFTCSNALDLASCSAYGSYMYASNGVDPVFIDRLRVVTPDGNIANLYKDIEVSITFKDKNGQVLDELTDVGSYTMVLTGLEADSLEWACCVGTVEFPVEVKDGTDIQIYESNLIIPQIENLYFYGEAITLEDIPTMGVEYNSGLVLAKGEDYTYRVVKGLGNPTEAVIDSLSEDYYLEITGQGDYFGTCYRLIYLLDPNYLGNAVVEAKPYILVSDNDKNPFISAAVDGKSLRENDDFIVNYHNVSYEESSETSWSTGFNPLDSMPTEPGDYAITIEQVSDGSAYYGESDYCMYSILPDDYEGEITEDSITINGMAASEFKASRQMVEEGDQAIQISVEVGGRKLVEGEDYIVLINDGEGLRNGDNTLRIKDLRSPTTVQSRQGITIAFSVMYVIDLANCKPYGEYVYAYNGDTIYLNDEIRVVDKNGNVRYLYADTQVTRTILDSEGNEVTNLKDVGTYTMVLDAIDQDENAWWDVYIGSVQFPLEVTEGRNIGEADWEWLIPEIDDLYYKGSDIAISLSTIKREYSDETVSSGTDFTYRVVATPGDEEGCAIDHVGTYYLEVRGINDYIGVFYRQFDVKDSHYLLNASIESRPFIRVGDEGKNPIESVSIDGTPLQLGQHYEVVWWVGDKDGYGWTSLDEQPTEVGYYMFEIVGLTDEEGNPIGTYYGTSQDCFYTIVPDDYAGEITSDCVTINGMPAEQFNGSSIGSSADDFDLDVEVVVDGTTLERDVDYSVSLFNYSNGNPVDEPVTGGDATGINLKDLREYTTRDAEIPLEWCFFYYDSQDLSSCEILDWTLDKAYSGRAVSHNKLYIRNSEGVISYLGSDWAFDVVSYTDKDGNAVDPINLGTYYCTIRAKEDAIQFTGETTFEFQIREGVDLSDGTTRLNFVGSETVPDTVFELDEGQLPALTYAHNTVAGNLDVQKLTIEVIDTAYETTEMDHYGSYMYKMTGSDDYFNVYIDTLQYTSPRFLPYATVVFDRDIFIQDGIAPKVTVTAAGTVLEEDVDYVIQYDGSLTEPSSTIGMHTLRVVGTGTEEDGYYGDNGPYRYVLHGANDIFGADVANKVRIAVGSEDVCPVTSVKMGETELKQDVDYRVRYFGRDNYGDFSVELENAPTDVGTYMAILEGLGTESEGYVGSYGPIHYSIVNEQDGVMFNVSLEAAYGQSEARTMLQMINDFRTGGDAWEWNESDTEKIVHNDLAALTYDYDLERVAMQRAAEIALQFDHQRPDAATDFSSLLSGFDYTAAGENLAAGQPSAALAFDSLCETNESYSGQGHRRNMLSSDFTSVGIGHVVVNGTHYWVQVFGSPQKETAVTNPDDSTKSVEIQVSSSVMLSRSALPDPNSITLKVGETAELPTVRYMLQLTGTWPGEPVSVTVEDIEWTSDDANVALVQDGAVVAKASGSTILKGDISLGSPAAVIVGITVEPDDVSDATVEFPDVYTYTGQPLTPDPVVKVDDVTLVNGRDYTVDYSDNTNVGEAHATVTLKGDYSGTASGKFTIEPARITTVTVQGDPFVYDGKAHEPEILVEAVTLTLAADEYDVEWADNTDAGMAKVMVTAKGNFTGTLTKAFTIEPAPITKVVFDQDSIEYTGEELEPTFKAYAESLEIPQDAYDVVYANNVNVKDTPTVTVTIKDGLNFTGALSQEFTITPAELTEMTLMTDEFEYAGKDKPIEPEVTGVKAGEIELASADYTVEYSNNTDVGTGTAKVVPSENGNVTGSLEKTFTITAPESSYDVTDSPIVSTVTAATTTIVDEEPDNGTVELYVTECGDLAIAGYKETVGLANNGNVAKFDAVDVKLVKVPENTPVEVAANTPANIIEGDIEPATLTFNVGNEYNGRVAAVYHFHDGAVIEEDTTWQTVENGAVSIDIDKLSDFGVAIMAEGFDPDISKADITWTDGIDAIKYDGSEHPRTFKASIGDEGLVKDKDYTFSYQMKSGQTWNNVTEIKNAGDYKVIVKGIGAYKGSAEKNFTIAALPVTLVSKSASKMYDGKPLTAPGVEVLGAGAEMFQSEVTDIRTSGTLTGSATKTMSANNTIDFTPTALFVAGNYQVTKKMGTLTVEALPQHTLTIKYVYADGKQAAKPYVKKFTEGAKYDVAVPAIAGYQATINGVNAAGVKGEMGKKDVTVTVTYKATVPSGKGVARSHRLYGDTALDTMAAIVNAGGFPTGGTVVLSTSVGYWDALTAAGIAGKANAPVLMTDGKSLSSQTKSLIQKLKPSKIIICGGTAAVTQAVENQAKAAAGGKPTVVRCAGDTATGTACKIFDEGGKIGTWSNTAFVCTNDGYWDALAAAPISYSNNMPIFLTEGKNSISSETLNTMKKGGISSVYIVGGTAAISNNVRMQIQANGIRVIGRFAGADAIETSQLVAQFGIDYMHMTPNYMGVATTDGYWDALAGAALCGSKGSVLVLANGPQATSVSSFMKKQADKIADFYIFGGVFAVSKATENAAITAAK